MVINLVDVFVQVTRPSSVPPNARDNLYQGLPPTVKAELRIRLQHSSKKDEVSHCRWLPKKDVKGSKAVHLQNLRRPEFEAFESSEHERSFVETLILDRIF